MGGILVCRFGVYKVEGIVLDKDRRWEIEDMENNEDFFFNF